MRKRDLIIVCAALAVAAAVAIGIFRYIFCQCPVVQFTIVILNPILYFLGMLFSSGKRYLFINTAILIDVCYHFLLRLY